MAKWSKEEILERIKNYSNPDLLQATIDAGSGDDYDGGFTNEGAFEYDELEKELRIRLADWLNK